MTRVSVSIPVTHHAALERMAERDRVSVSHVAAMAIERAVTEAEGGLLLQLQSAAPPAPTKLRRASRDAA
jgi:hypothetical protein